MAQSDFPEDRRAPGATHLLTHHELAKGRAGDAAYAAPTGMSACAEDREAMEISTARTRRRWHDVCHALGGEGVPLCAVIARHAGLRAARSDWRFSARAIFLCKTRLAQGAARTARNSRLYACRDTSSNVPQCCMPIFSSTQIDAAWCAASSPASLSRRPTNTARRARCWCRSGSAARCAD